MALSTKDDRVSDKTPGSEKPNAYNPESLNDQEQGRIDDQFVDIAANFDDQADPRQENANINRAAGINDMESMPRDGWQTDVDPKIGGINEQNYKNKPVNKAIKVAKKGGPFGLIIAVLLGGAGMISFFGGPGLLLVHIAEVIVEKVDFQVGSAEARSRRITEAKLTNSTTGACSKLASFRCKYATFSKKEVARFQSNGAKNLGLEVTFSEDKSAFGRYRMETMTIDGKTVPPNQFKSEMRSNAQLRSAMLAVNNWRYNSKGDKRFNDFARKNAIKKTNVLAGADNDEDRMKRVVTNTSIGAEGTITLGDEPEDCDQACKDDRENRKRGIELSDEARQKAESKVKTANPSGFRKFVRKVSVTGGIADVCIIPQTIGAIAHGAKLVRSVQMIRYAMVFLTASSMIKAGDADPGTISFLGSILTTTFTNSEGNSTKAATDSFGFRNIAFGDKGTSESATLAMVGGGVGGVGGRGLATKAYEIAGAGDAGRGRSSCDFFTNPFVEGVGVLLNFIPGVGAGAKLSTVAIGQIAKRVLAMGLKVGGQALAINYLIGYLTDIGIDIAAGVVADEDTYGEEAGDLLASGTREALTQTAAFGGNMILTPDQAVAYTGLNNKTMAMYGDYEAATKSSLDPTSRHTMVGSLYSSFLPYMSAFISPTVPETISSLQSIVSAPLSLLNTPTKAVTSEDFRECEDYDYRDRDVATGPMCHLIRGVPSKYLDLHPLMVAEDLFAADHIDDTGLPASDQYKKMIEVCWSGDVIEYDELPMCTARKTSKESAAEFDTRMKISIHYIDERINEVNENGLPEPGYTSTPPGSPPASGIGLPTNLDDSSVQCHPGTEDLGTIKSVYKGRLVETTEPEIRVCLIEDIPGWGAGADGAMHQDGAVVNAAVSDRYYKLAQAAKAAGVSLYANSSFRTSTPCSPGDDACASPGLSNHEIGGAIDFQMKTPGVPGPKGSKCDQRKVSDGEAWNWLDTNAPKLGIKQLARESWHWDIEVDIDTRCPS